MGVLEKHLQADCVQMLRSAGIFCHSVPNEGCSDIKRRMQLTAMGMTAGVADLVVWWPSGIGYIEFKTPGGAQSRAQKTFQRLCNDMKISYIIVKSTEEMERVIDSRLSLLRMSD